MTAKRASFVNFDEDQYVELKPTPDGGLLVIVGDNADIEPPQRVTLPAEKAAVMLRVLNEWKEESKR